MIPARRFFVGDPHGCRSELDALLERFEFRPGIDSLFCTGDVVGKGPDTPGALRRLEELNATVVRGNHDQHFLRLCRIPTERLSHVQREYLGPFADDMSMRSYWEERIASWPLYVELDDVLLVHAGLEPGKHSPAEMSERALLTIRTWDGYGADLNNPADPPWFECVKPEKTVVFGHWAQMGLVDLPRFKGLDSGCVYGKQLTGWCPEEERFYQVHAERVYSPPRGRS